MGISPDTGLVGGVGLSPVVGTGGEGIAKQPSSPSYTGPLDLVPGAVVAYGVRALSAAWLGQNIFRLRRDSDDAEMNFAADAVTGEAPVAAIATWLTATTGFVVTWYDQSGNSNDITAATDANEPIFDISSQGGRSSLESTDEDVLQKESAVTLSSWDLTFFSVTRSSLSFYAPSFSKDSALIAASSGDQATAVMRSDGSNIREFLYAGQINDSSFYLNEIVQQNESSIYLANGVALTLTGSEVVGALVGSPPANMLIVLQMATGVANSSSQEIIVWNSVMSAGNRTAVRSNIMSYYSIP